MFEPEPQTRDGIVVGQIIDRQKIQRSRELRRTMTAAEARLWEYLRSHRLSGLHFRRQQIIDGFIADFYCHAARLVVEVDGEAHRSRADYDAERDQVLRSRGLRVLRVLNDSVLTDLVTVLGQIEALARSTRQGS